MDIDDNAPDFSIGDRVYWWAFGVRFVGTVVSKLGNSYLVDRRKTARSAPDVEMVGASRLKFYSIKDFPEDRD